MVVLGLEKKLKELIQKRQKRQISNSIIKHLKIYTFEHLKRRFLSLYYIYKLNQVYIKDKLVCLS